MLPAISTDHSPVLISLSNDNSDNNGRVLWKCNSSLVYDVESMKKTNYKSYYFKWISRRCPNEMGIFKIWNSKIYAKTAAKIRKQHKIDLEQKLKILRAT